MKKIILVLFVIFAVVFGLFYREVSPILDTIFPNRNVIFNYSNRPVYIDIKNVKYKVPKAYLYWHSDMKGGKLDKFNLRASIKDNMVPWTLSESFKKKDEDSEVTIYISSGYIEPYRSEFPYDDINDAKRRGGGENRGTYKKIFTRYDGVTRIRQLETGIKKRMSRFFLIPNVTKEEYFISCPNHDPDIVYCTVTRLYAKDITYQFLIPHRFVERFLEYDKAVAQLVDKLKVNYGYFKY